MVFIVVQIHCAARVSKQWYMGCVVRSGSSVADVYPGYSLVTFDHSEPVPEASVVEFFNFHSNCQGPFGFDTSEFKL